MVMPDLEVRALEVVDTPVSKLKPWGRNPRTITAARLEQLKAMVAASPEMLQARPLIALLDGTVIAGNQRLAAVQALGWLSVPAVFVDLDEAEAVEWAFRDNNPAGETDPDLAAELLAELGARGRPLDMTGFAPVELSSLLRRIAPDVDPDAVPPVPAKPRSKRGEVYELGPHRLMCGDATSPDDVAKLLTGEPVDLLFTSPPYLDLRTYGGDLNLDPLHLAAFIGVWASHSELLAVNLGMVVRQHEIVRHWDVYIAAANQIGLKLLSWNVWDRHDATSMAAQKMMFPLWHEFVFVFGEKPRDANRVLPTNLAGRMNSTRAQRRPDGSMGPPRDYPVAALKRQGSVLTTPSAKGATPGDHPATFPVALPAAYIEAVTQPGELIADPFSGSGTTLIAAEQLARRCFAMEIDPAYCDVIRKRYADYVGDQKWAP